jgi:hypothetical protein
MSLGIHKIRTDNKKSDQTIEEFVFQSNVITNIISQSESDIGCSYSDEIEIFPSNLSKKSKISELAECKDPLLIFNTQDIDRTRIKERFKSIESRLNSLEKDNAFLKKDNAFLKADNNFLKADNANIKADNANIKEELLYPLLIRELLKQSR